MSEITDEFVRCYGEISEYYDEETWLEKLGVFSAGWQSAMVYLEILRHRERIKIIESENNRRGNRRVNPYDLHDIAQRG